MGFLGVKLAKDRLDQTLVLVRQLNAVTRPEVGKAAGVRFRFLGGVSGIAIVGAPFAGGGSYGSAQAFSNGFVAALAGSAALSLVGAFCGLALPERRAAVLSGVKQKA